MRVVVASPAALLREALVRALGDAPETVEIRTADSLAELRRICVRCTPDIAVTESVFGDGALIDVLGTILRGNVRVLVVTDRDDTATTLLFAGASGCLDWSAGDAEQLRSAVREVAAGHAALHPAAAAAVLANWRATQPRPTGHAAAAPTLTPRESDVLAGLARGLTTRGIGRALHLSPKTVEVHIGKLLVKLGARNRAQAVSAASAHGLLGQSQP